MGDLTNPKLIYFKGILFLVSGILASTILLLESPHLKTAGLLCLAVFCFARFYYFAFYVIQHYVDSHFKFAGLLSFGRYLLNQRRALRGEHNREPGE